MKEVERSNSGERRTIEHESHTALIRALEIRGYPERVIDEVIRELRQRIPELMTSLQNAIATDQSGAHGDALKQIGKDAHSAKGVLNSIEMHETAEIALEVEKSARAGENRLAVSAATTLVEKLRSLAAILED